jgi:ATP-binding cassette, subfamily B, bacterial
MKARGAYTDVVLFKRLLGEARPYWRHIGLIFVVSMLAAPLTLLTPVPLKIAVDSVIGTHPVPGFLDALLPAAVTGSDNTLLAVLAGMFVLIAVLAQVQSTGTTVLQTYTGEGLVLRFRSKLFQHTQRLSLAYHDRIGTADSTYRIQYDAMAAQYVAVQSAISFITAVTTLAGMLYVTYLIDHQLALVALAVSPPILLIAKVFRPRMRGRSREVKKLESNALSVVQEVLTGLRVVRAFGQEDREHERFLGRAGEGMRARIRLALVEGAYSLLVGATIGAGGAAVLFIGMSRVESGAITLGDLLLVMGYLAQLYAPLKMMAKNAGTLQKSLASAERTFAILDQAPELPERPRARSLARASGAVRFCGVSFAYEPNRPVLNDVSFAVEPGERVGIAGPTGAGKSTLMNLLTRLYDPTSGRILLDGVDLRDYKVADLRKQFGIVLQEPVLFSTSLAENIAYARPEANEAEIEAAGKAANAHDFIVALPDGYATQVGERGMRLSGGERQRISLARAFLKDAPILVLDEPTSSVDVNTEAVITEAMERLMAGRTSFMIAHRLSTLDVCERRLEIDHGRIVDAATAGAPVAAGQPALNGAGASAARTPAASEVIRSGLEDHPAVKAWSRLRPSDRPGALTVLKKKRKAAAFRLEGCGPEGRSVIAKRCDRSTAELERTVYEHVLPGLPIRSLRYHGTVKEDADWCWMFLEDAGGEPYSPFIPEHRRLAARWLAALHGSAAEIPEASRLPDRGPDHYLGHLCSAREALLRQLRDRAAEEEEVRLLATLLSQLEVLDSRWGDVRAFCETLPRTVVHGDLSRSHLRIRAGATGMDLVAFDWEMAGWGVPAPDVAHLGSRNRLSAARFCDSGQSPGFCLDPCLETYGSALGDGSAHLDRETVELMATVGNLFRCIATVDWTSRRFTPGWTPVTTLHPCSLWLSNAMQVTGWDGASHGSR